LKKDKIIIKIELTPEEYKSLEAISKAQGYELPSHMIKAMIKQLLRGELETGVPRGESIDVDLLSRRLRRTIEDLLNPFTGKIDEILRKLGEIIEMLEQGRVAQPVEAVQERRAYEEERARPRYAGKKRSAIDRLREDGALFSSEARWINETERFFAYLKRQGAIVFSLGDEYIAVHPDFWDKFKNLLEETAIRNRDEVERLLESSLGNVGVKLFRKLAALGLVYYDEENASWIVEEPG
jgi:hypothetical protein